MLRWSRILLLAVLAMGITTVAAGQGITTGTLAGSVADSTGAMIPGAKVELKNAANGIDLIRQSGADGSFKFFAVPIGSYKIAITATGFSVENINNVAVKSGATTDVGKVQLKVGASEQIEVNGSSAALLETSDSQVTTSFDAQSMQSLPLNNGFDTVVELIPGVVSTGDDNFSNTNGDNYSVNGQSGRYNNFELDGQSNNDNSIGGPQIFFGNQDAIQEIQVITNDYSAQYGRNAGAVENYITKSGTNAFHGTVFEFYQGQFLSSLANQDKSPVFGYCSSGEDPTTSGCTPPFLPRYVENRAGGTFGGPLIKNKLFFFGSTFWDRLREGASPSQSLPALTPDPTGLSELQAAFPGNSGVAAVVGFGPYAITQGNPQPITSSIVQETVTGPGGQTATVEFAGVQRTIASLFNDQEELGRLDWQPTTKDHLFLRYFYQPQLSTGIEGQYSIAAGDFVNVPATAHSVGADWSHSFTSRLVDQLRYSFQEAKVYFEGGAYPNCVATSIQDCPAQVNFIGANNDSDFGGDVLFPQGRTVKVTQVQNNATWTHGRQTVLFGGEFDYQNSPNVGLFFYNGEPNYGTFSNLLQNGPGSFSTAYSVLADGNPVIPFTEPDVALYLEDDWKATPDLTLNLGLRWEFFSQAVNKLHQETVARESNAATAFWDTSLPLADRTAVEAEQNYKNFEPRFGFAWNPSTDKKLVVRGGYAINANPAFYNMFLLEASGAPVVNTGAILCGSGACLPSNGSLLSSDFRATNLPFLPRGGDPRVRDQETFPTTFRTPYVQTYTLGVDHQLGKAAVGEARYVGAKTTDDFQSTNSNPYLRPVSIAFPQYVSPSSLCTDPTANGYGRPDCNYANVAKITNGGWANYQALELNLTTQNYRGLTSTVSYTWSHALNNATDAFRSTGGGGSTIAYSQNPLNTDIGERGSSGNDFPNTLGAGFTYNLPKFIENHGLVSYWVNGYQLSGVYRFRSGQDYTPFQLLNLDSNNGDSSYCDAVFNSSSVGPGADTCRLVVSNKKAPINTVAYLNPYTGGQDPMTGAPLLGTPIYVVYGSDGYSQSGVYSPGTAVDPTTTHWIINNQAYAHSVGNPYPGWGRSLARGPSFSELDATISKTTHLTERVSLQLSLAAYNALNQMYLGVGNPNVEASNFTSNLYNTSGSSSGNTSGNRFVILGSRIIF